MTESPPSAAEQLFAALAELRKATVDVSYTTLVRQAAAQRPPLKISRQRLSDWFSGEAVPADPAVVRFLVNYLQPRAARNGYQQRPLPWWLTLHQEAARERQASNDAGRGGVDASPLSRRLGRPVGDCDPIDLEVHRAIHVPGEQLDQLPEYVPRAHDTRLREAVDEMLVGGTSRLVTLVGGSSTGKTRACWELVEYLEQHQPGRWWLWHPYDPTRPDAAVADLDRVGPDTIVWLNEAQFYLQPTDVRIGEQVAAGLRTLLHDPARGPVLVLATLWPQYWNKLTHRPDPGVPDPYAQARDLLADSMVSVADGFTSGELAGLQNPGTDPRLRQAVDHAEGGRITQYLAGAPGLEDRYRTAPPAARAVIQVAMDARRFGHPPVLPHALLEQAAPGYLDDHDWDSTGEDWLEQALAYTARPCKGARGPMTLIRPRPGQLVPDGGQPCYRLADYLEQTGRNERAGIYPPENLWRAFSRTVADPALLLHLGRQAGERGRYQHAIWLYNQAADRGSTRALQALASMRERAGDTAGAEALYRQAADHGDTFALSELAKRRERVGDTAGAEALYWQAADHGNTDMLRVLASMREQAGDTAGAEALYRQAADRGNTGALCELAMRRERVGDTAGAEALYWQAANHGDTLALRELAKRREQAGDTAGAEALAVQAADHGNTDVLRELAGQREQAGDTAGAEALYRQAADRGNTDVLLDLAERRERAGDTAGAEALYRQAADRGDTLALVVLAERREQAGDTSGAEALLWQAADRGSQFALGVLALMWERAGYTADADRMGRFGLTGSGDVATALDFDS
jgi:hypothetical protein